MSTINVNMLLDFEFRIQKYLLYIFLQNETHVSKNRQIFIFVGPLDPWQKNVCRRMNLIEKEKFNFK